MLLVAVSTAFARSTASFGDVAGDANEAPDITSVTVSDAAGGQLTVRIGLRNLPVLPPDTRFFLQFDLDNNSATGSAGDEAVILYTSDGTIELFRWTGFELAPSPPSGITASFSAGVLTVTANRAQLPGTGPFGLVAVAARRQVIGGAAAVATDFAPGATRSVYSPPGEMSFQDPENDEDVAPDITEMSVTDARNGVVTFRITTSNYRTLPQDKLIGLGLDLLGRPSSNDELFITYQGGPGSIDIEREEDGLLTQDTPPNKVTSRYEDGVLTLGVHRSELDDVAAFKFGAITADLTADGEAEGDDAVGEIEAVDTSPEGLETGTLFTYRLTNPPPVRLGAGPAKGVPAAPRAGKPFTLSVVVTRSDTGKTVRAGKVGCAGLVSGAKVRASGGFRAGKARCSLAIPAAKSAAKLRITMQIRAAGASLRAVYSFTIR